MYVATETYILEGLRPEKPIPYLPGARWLRARLLQSLWLWNAGVFDNQGSEHSGNVRTGETFFGKDAGAHRTVPSLSTTCGAANHFVKMSVSAFFSISYLL